MQKYIFFKTITILSFYMSGLTHQLFYLGEPARQEATLPSVADNNSSKDQRSETLAPPAAPSGCPLKCFWLDARPPKT